jgi:hypothetical protein
VIIIIIIIIIIVIASDNTNSRPSFTFLTNLLHSSRLYDGDSLLHVLVPWVFHSTVSAWNEMSFYLFIDAVSGSDCTVSNDGMNIELVLFGLKRPWPNLRQCSISCLDGLRKSPRKSDRIVGLWTEILNLPNTIQDHQLLGHYVRYNCISVSWQMQHQHCYCRGCHAV